MNTHKFTGKELDGSGLYYFGARYYDKGLGRWLTTDPVLNMDGMRYNIPDPKVNPRAALNLHNPQDLNPYVYCTNNPLRYVDNNGEFILVVEYNKEAQYGSKALVWNGLFPDGIFDMKTRADIRGTNVALVSGFYNYELGSHKGTYFARHNALIINNNKEVSVEEPNPVHGGKKVATGIHVHAGNPENESNKGRTGSAGCWTVPTVKEPAKSDRKNPSTWTYYNKFISSFKKHPKGKALLIRLYHKKKEEEEE